MNKHLKHYDVALLGNHPGISYIARSLPGKTLLVSDQPHTTRLLDQKTLHHGEDVSIGRALIIVPPKLNTPVIKGLDTTPHHLLSKLNKVTTSMNSVVLGNGAGAISFAIRQSLAGRTTHLLNTRSSILTSHDETVQHVVSEYLSRIKIHTTSSSTAQLVQQIAEGIEIIGRAGSQPLHVRSQFLGIEPSVSRNIQAYGVNNVLEIEQQAEGSPYAKYMGSIMVVDPTWLHSLSRLQDAAQFLARGKKATLHDGYTATAENIEGMIVATYGMREQDLKHSHIAYKRSVARLPSGEKHSRLSYFIKVITSRKNNIIGVSLVGEPRQNHLYMCEFAVRKKLPVAELASLIGANDPYMNAISEVIDDIRLSK